MDVEALIARPVAGLLPVDDARGALRVLIASLAPGGAERIVLDWLAAERSRGRAAELAVLHARRNSLRVPQGIRVRTRGKAPVEEFLQALAAEWSAAPAPVSTHLVSDDLLSILWQRGVRTLPTVHNAPEGWRNDPTRWRERDVPAAIACAESVRRELIARGCRVPVFTLRHRPRVGAAACDPGARAAIRRELRIGPGTLLLGAIGAIKPQKDYVRAIEVLAALSKRRDAALAILGGVLDAAGLAELDRVMGRSVRLGVAARVRLPGFVTPVDPWLAACDAVINVSRFEGLSIAVQEALAAGLPVVATAVGGQAEIDHPALELVDARESPRSIAQRLAAFPVRTALAVSPFARAPRAWSVPMGVGAPASRRLDTLFVTANLNAGGAQRSLVNLACAIAPRHRIALAVCGESTQGAFAAELRRHRVEAFRPAAAADPLELAESLLAHAAGCRTLCFWNVDARLKLLVAKFAPSGLRLVDVSPGEYAFDEMAAAASFAASVATSGAEYYERLDALVHKYVAKSASPCRRIAVIPNGVEYLAACGAPDRPRFLVSGRIAPSKRLEEVLAAFARVREAKPDAELHVFGRIEERHRAYAVALALDAPGIALRGESFDHGHFREPWTAAVVLGTHQGSPNAVLEAMAAGVAVIANDSGGTRESVAHGVTGWLLPEKAGAGALAHAMLEAAGDPGRAAAMGVRGREHVRAHNTIEEMARKYLAILAPETAMAHEKMAPWIPAPASPPTCASLASSR